MLAKKATDAIALAQKSPKFACCTPLDLYAAILYHDSCMQFKREEFWPGTNNPKGYPQAMYT